MTREEAIKYLEWLSDIDFTKEYPKYPIVTKREQVEALQMAIEALRNKNDLPISPLLKEPKQPENGSEQFGNTEKLGDRITDDCISREAAIDLIESIETERLKGNVGLIYAPAIKGLRALLSAQPNLQPICNKLATDTISRQDANDILDEFQESVENGFSCYAKAEGQGESKTGHWTWIMRSKYKCSECEHETTVDECMEKPMYIYCPYCGAKMEEGD